MERRKLNHSLASLLPEIKTFVAGREEILVVTHFFPDGDAIGSLLAFGGMLEQLEISFTLAVDDPCPQKYNFLAGFESVKNLKQEALAHKFSRVVILDAGAISRIGSAKKYISETARILNIDHHLTGDIVGSVNLINTEASATSEMLFDLFQALDIVITKDMAMALYTGILTDTGRFRFANTTSHAMHVAAELIAIGIDPGLLTENIYFNIPAAQMKSLAKALESLEIHGDGRICIIGLNGAETVNDTEGFVEYAASIQGVELAVFYSLMEPGMFKVSLRSRCDIDVSEIALKFGGGGHRKASGFRYRGDLPILKARLLDVLTKSLPPKDNAVL